MVSGVDCSNRIIKTFGFYHLSEVMDNVIFVFVMGYCSILLFKHSPGTTGKIALFFYFFGKL